jgi:hypothetical protein
VYLVTFKFNNIPGSNTPTISEMLREIENQFYPTLIKHVERWPLKPSRQRNLPRLLAIPDLPVQKTIKKLSARDIKINNRLHVHAFVVMAPTLRTLLNGANLNKTAAREATSIYWALYQHCRYRYCSDQKQG